ncbi:helix-turn-helix domain-containing protein [Halorubrum sp. AD140]|uniref:helix-turn-helix domain-containing protein n=1 Tax=Halorubrum sp. AD140 TaxID=3050073 RepID=UPI002ACD0F50|nr:helix-turn-helix domain-containing protein [Halorubrum sp. AD140]MDZ5809938.1 helix-turn-helix domain-containing protein [Halorubrum sp. AD140]
METVVDATIPTDQFVLEESIERVPDVEFEFVRFAAHRSARTMPFVWGSTDRPDRLDVALRRDPSTEGVSCLSTGDGRSLYSIDWTASASRLVDGFIEAGGSVLGIRGTSERWTVQILFPDRATASETFHAWRDDDVSPSLSRVSNLSCRTETGTGMSATQYDTIATAFQRNYYDVPRGTTLSDLATDLEVSHQALSERLRRGHSHLVERMLSESATAVTHRS